MKRFGFILTVLLPVFLMAQSYLHNDGNSLRIGNNTFELTFDISDCRLQPAFLRNKIARTTYKLSSDLFELTLTFPGEGITPPKNVPQNFSARDFNIDKIEQIRSSNSLRVMVQLSGNGLLLKYFISVYNGKPWFRVSLWVKDNADFAPFLQKISPWHISLKGIQPRLGGFGQPIYTDNLFMGIEFPAAHNDYSKSQINGWHYVAQKLSQKTFYQSHSMVIGCSRENQVQSAFYKYIRSLRPRKDSPFVLYNTWYDIRQFTYDKLMNTIHDFKSTLIDKYGLRLDAFVIDDGWDNVHSVWEIDRQKFPQGFSPLVTELKKMHSALGLWISPWNGYDKARTERIEWAKKHGFKLSAGRHLCLGDTAYYKIFKEKVLQYQKEGQLSFYKIDGFLSVCNESEHNHLPGIYSRELLTRRFIEILQALRRQNPEIFIDITVGTWLSPWWLQYADAVWMTGADYGHAEDVPAFSERDKAITFRDYTLYKDFVRDKIQFPLTNVMTHGIIKGKFNLLGGKNETLRNWQNNAIMYFARGVMMWELYLTPELVSSDEWDFLASVMKWGMRNTNILQNTRFIGGNPYSRQIYGYVHQKGNEALLVLRNPFIKPQNIRISLNDLLKGQKDKTFYAVQTLYPNFTVHRELVTQDKPLNCRLEGYQVKVLQLKPVAALPPLPQGLYLKPLSVKRKKAVFEAYFDPAQTNPLRFINKSELKKLTVYGKQINLDAFKNKVQNLRRQAMLENEAPFNCRVEMNSMSSRNISGVITGSNVKTEPGNRLGILLDFAQPVDSLEIRLTGKSQVPKIVKKGAEGRWYWILIEQKELKTPLKFSLHVHNQNVPHGKISFWNLYRKSLIKLGTLGIESKKSVFKNELTIPVAANYLDRTENILTVEF